MFNSLRWQYLKQWLSNREGRKEASSSSQPPPLISLDNQLSPQLGDSQSSPNRLYWCSFRAHDGSFLGVVLTRGDSPGKAASKAIDKLDLPTNRASIVAIPLDKESPYFIEYQDLLLTEEEATKLLQATGTKALTTF